MNREFFMGVSTPNGFKTDFYNEHKDCYGYYIKGGPGTGKSTLMRKLAEHFSDENISVYYCSSDPSSIDAVVFEDKRIFFADATAPHESNPKLPYITGEYVDLAAALFSERLGDASSDAIQVNEQNQALHKMVQKHLSVICKLQTDIIKLGKELTDQKTLDNLVLSLCKKLPQNTCPRTASAVYKQAISITPHGKLWHLPDNCEIFFLKDRLLYASLYAVEAVKAKAVQSGLLVECTRSYTQSIYPDIMIYMPELNFAICADQTLPKNMQEAASIIELDNVYKTLQAEEYSSFVGICTKTVHELEGNAVDTLSRALQVHDELEAFYIDAIDKKSLNKKFTELKNRL